MKTIIVPYRDRPGHLEAFIDHMHQFSHIRIAVIEQGPGKPFNRGRLLNIGALEFPDVYYIMHDVDMLLNPDEWYDSSPHAEVIQMASSKIQLRDYLGGVTMFTHPVFHKAGGYHNDYFHRAEDNEMRFNLQRLRIPVLEEHKKFTTLPHPRNDKQEFIASLWQKAQQKRSEQNQLAHCEYQIEGREAISSRATLLKVQF